MSAASSRRNLRRENVRRLSQAEPGLSHRQLAERLGIGKDTVRRDLDALAREADAEPDAPSVLVAPQVIAVGAEPVAPDAPVAQPAQTARAVPGRMAPLDGAPDLSQWPALRRDLAVLAQSGSSREALVHQAVVAVAYAYRQALDRGELQLGDRFIVRGVELRPAAQLADRPVPDSARRP